MIQHTENAHAEQSRPEQAEMLFTMGCHLMEKGESRMAGRAFRKALKIKPLEPRYLSYLGLSIALVDKKADEAIILCEEAAREVYYDPDLFCNLGRVYLQFGRKKEAFIAFKRGLAVDLDNERIHRQLVDMGIRKPLVFPFLKRSHFANHYAGLILTRFGWR